MKKSFLKLDILYKSIESLRFLDKSSKRLIKILVFQFLLMKKTPSNPLNYDLIYD